MFEGRDLYGEIVIAFSKDHIVICGLEVLLRPLVKLSAFVSRLPIDVGYCSIHSFMRLNLKVSSIKFLFGLCFRKIGLNLFSLHVDD